MNKRLKVVGLTTALVLFAPMAIGQSSPASAPLVPIAAPEGLMTNERAGALIASDPSVVQARQALEAARHRAVALAAGPYEWTAKAGTQRRRYTNGSGTVTEWSAGVERPIRIGGKAELDRRLAELQLAIAAAKLGEARHEAAISLVDLVAGIQAAERTRSLWAEQLAFAQTNLRAAETRRRAGDASMLDQNIARADVAEVQRQLGTAALEVAKLRARFAVRFGPEPIPALPATGPSASLADPAIWRERILAESDPLKIARTEVEQAEITARRLSADRLPDPTVGVHAGSEAGGAERILGLTVSIPLGGTYRNAQHREALQQVEVARASLQRVLQETEATVAQNLAEAQGSLERLRFADEGRTVAAQNAQLTQRAYTLGEVDLQSLLLARRQSVDAALGAAQALSEALRARYRLLIDAHLIWGLEEE